MTIIDMVAAPVETETEPATIPADTQPDIQLSEPEKDAVIKLVADNEETPTVPGNTNGARRAWGQPSPGRNELERD